MSPCTYLHIYTAAGAVCPLHVLRCGPLPEHGAGGRGGEPGDSSAPGLHGEAGRMRSVG